MPSIIPHPLPKTIKYLRGEKPSEFDSHNSSAQPPNPSTWPSSLRPTLFAQLLPHLPSMAAPNGQQPDWKIVLQALQDITTQAALMPNVPAFHDGNQILPVLDRFKHYITVLQQGHVHFHHQLGPFQPGEATIRQELATIGQELATLQHGQDTLRQRQEATEERVAILQPRIEALEQQRVHSDQRADATEVNVAKLQAEISRQ